MRNTEHAVWIEFVCSVCLASATVLDTDKPPHCPRGHGRMEADDLDVAPALPPRVALRAQKRVG
jgi:hypothetical protein